MMNERALTNFNLATEYMNEAVTAQREGQINDAIALTGFVGAALDLARFCVENHALVAGVDEDVADVNHPNERANSGLWGGMPMPPGNGRTGAFDAGASKAGPPVPSHIQAAIDRGQA